MSQEMHMSDGSSTEFSEDGNNTENSPDLDPKLFDGLTAWFSSSVCTQYKDLWVANSGQLTDVDSAMFVFSENAEAEDTKQLYRSEAYLEDHLAVFHAAYIQDCINHADLALVAVGDFFLPPAELHNMILRQTNFKWEELKDDLQPKTPSGTEDTQPRQQKTHSKGQDLEQSQSSTSTTQQTIHKTTGAPRLCRQTDTPNPPDPQPSTSAAALTSTLQVPASKGSIHKKQRTGTPQVQASKGSTYTKQNTVKRSSADIHHHHHNNNSSRNTRTDSEPPKQMSSKQPKMVSMATVSHDTRSSAGPVSSVCTTDTCLPHVDDLPMVEDDLTEFIVGQDGWQVFRH